MPVVRGLNIFSPAVTLDGTIIHKSGLMTGGRSSRNSGKKWEEKDMQGTAFIPFFVVSLYSYLELQVFNALGTSSSLIFGS